MKLALVMPSAIKELLSIYFVKIIGDAHGSRTLQFCCGLLSYHVLNHAQLPDHMVVEKRCTLLCYHVLLPCSADHALQSPLQWST